MAASLNLGRRAIPDYLLDGNLVLAAVLSRGLDVLALPRQVLLAGRTSLVPAEISFTHGVPEASTLSGVTFAQDQRLRRALAQRVGVELPQGATFTWRSLRRAQEWARTIGFPVVVKDARGENPARAVYNVNNPDELREAFEELRRRRPEDRSPGSNPHLAGYAATRLGYIIDDDGNEVAPLHTRMLVEKQLPGKVLRCVVVGGRVAGVFVHTDNGQVVSEVLKQGISTKIEELAIRAANAIPGLGVAMIDIATEEAPARAEQAMVVEVGERPRLHTIYPVDPELAHQIASDIVDFQAGKASLELKPPLEEITGEIEIDGLGDVAEAAEQLPVVLSEDRIDIEVISIDEREGNLSARVTATPKLLADAIDLLMTGALIDDRAMSIEFKHASTDA